MSLDPCPRLPEACIGLGDVLEARAEQLEDRVLYRYLETGDVDGPVTEWSFRATDTQARCVAAALAECVPPRGRVLLLFPPGLDFIAGFFGCLYADALAVPAYPPDPSRLAQTLPRLQAIVADAGATVVLTTAAVVRMSEALGAIAPDLAALRWIAVDQLDASLGRGVVRRRPGADTVAFLQYTSGSTGEPKGVMVTHGNLLANLVMMRDAVGITSRDSAVGWLPLFHDLGLIGNVLESLYAGATATLMSPLDFLKKPMRWLHAVSRTRGTVCGGPDFAYDLCARKATPEDLASLDLTSWRAAFTAAEPIRAATLARFSEVFAPCGFDPRAFLPAYGLAEVSLMTTVGAPGQPVRIESIERASLRAGRAVPAREGAQPMVGCGRPPAGATVVIVDPATSRELAEGEVGEVQVAGEHVAVGYFGRDELSERTFGATLPTRPGMRFLRTGDLGYVRGGELFVTGRSKDLIIVRGRNHYPQDIERTAEAAARALRPGCSAAFSVERDGREAVVLVAEVDEGSSGGLDALVADVRTAVAEHHQLELEDVLFVRPRSILKTSSGKIQRSACRAAWESGALEVVHTGASLRRENGTPAPATPADRRAETLALLLELVRVRAPGARAEQSLPSLGYDSLATVELAGALEKRLGFTVPTEVFFGHTLSQVAALLAEGSSGAASLTTAVDFERESSLPDELGPTCPFDGQPGPVLLTGATGFLGAHLLAELLERTDASTEVVCLVRARDAGEGRARLRAALERIGRLRDEHVTRIRALPGELAAPWLGLAPEAFRSLASEVSAVYHCGALVHWALPYAALREANVAGTRAVLELAAPRNVPLHYVSSLGVFPIAASSRDWFPEEADLAEPELLDVGYFQSKWVAEKLLERARRRGFEVTVYRPGFVTGHSASGQDSGGDGQLFHAFLRGCIELGAVPHLDKSLDVVPVDFVARAVIALSLRPEARGRCFNLVNPSPARQLEVYSALRARGWKLRELPYALWRDEVVALPDKNPENPLARFVGYYRALSEARMRRLAQQTATRMPVEDRNTRALLAKDLACPPFDAALLGTYIDRFVADGRLDAPASRATVPPPASPSHFVARYAIEDDRLGRLYDRGKQKQWDAAKRIDWSLDLDPENPQELPDTGLPLYGSGVFDTMTRAERAALRRHFQAWQLSQFMHGEQGALLCAAKIVQQAPTFEAKLYASTQVVDEGRHLEAFARLLHEKFELSYPVSTPLKTLLDDVLRDSRWDMTLLGMQVLVEGLALAAFSLIRDQSKNPLASAVNAYVMEDEARHLAFGRITLEGYYPHLSEAERDEREQFVVEASYLLRDRFQGSEVWEALGLPVAACQAHVHDSGFLRTYRSQLFSRIVPVIRAIGLWGPRVRTAYAKMGVLGFGNVDLDAVAQHDERAAREIEQALAASRGADAPGGA